MVIDSNVMPHQQPTDPEHFWVGLVLRVIGGRRCKFGIVGGTCVKQARVLSSCKMQTCAPRGSNTASQHLCQFFGHSSPASKSNQPQCATRVFGLHSACGPEMFFKRQRCPTNVIASEISKRKQTNWKAMWFCRKTFARMC